LVTNHRRDVEHHDGRHGTPQPLPLLRVAAGQDEVVREATDALQLGDGQLPSLGRVSKALGVLPPPVYGYFDPPWTPAFLRRNEVMLRTDAGQ